LENKEAVLASFLGALEKSMGLDRGPRREGGATSSSTWRGEAARSANRGRGKGLVEYTARASTVERGNWGGVKTIQSQGPNGEGRELTRQVRFKFLDRISRRVVAREKNSGRGKDGPYLIVSKGGGSRKGTND